MAFRDFSFADIKDVFKVSIVEAPIEVSRTPLPVDEFFIQFIEHGLGIASANSTEKARSEFVIAPILVQLQRATGSAFRLFSGVEWNHDRIRGLNGYCDFLLTHGENQYLLEPPFAVVVEAKNEVIQSGFGQCMSAMIAAAEANAKAGAVFPIFGVVTYGELWKLLRLENKVMTIDSNSYLVNDLPLLMGVLAGIVRKPTLAAVA